MATYADGHGVAKCKTVPLDRFHAMMLGSELFTGAALDMLGQSPADDELAVFPDPDAIVHLPWRPEVAFAPGNVYLHGGPWSDRTDGGAHFNMSLGAVDGGANLSPPTSVTTATAAASPSWATAFSPACWPMRRPLSRSRARP